LMTSRLFRKVIGRDTISKKVSFDQVETANKTTPPD